VQLLPGDVIYIPPVGPQVAVFGSVRNSAIFELSGETTVDQVLQDAGGLSTLASLSRASLERIDAEQRQQAMDIALNPAGLSTKVRDGDILRVLPISPRFDKTVTVRGNLADPGRFAWHPGMKLSELLPNSQSLITRNYWQQRNQLGLPSPAFEPDYTQRFKAYQQNLYARYPFGYQYGYGQNQQQSGQGWNPQQGYGVPQPQQGQISGGTQFPGIPLPFFGDPTQLQSQDATTIQPFSPQFQSNGVPSGQQTQPNSPNQYQRPNYIGGGTLAEQQRQTQTENTAGATAITNVNLPVPEIDWSFAVIERLDPVTLRTSLIPFDLGKLVLDHDASQDLAVQPSDVITIFSQADIHVPQAQQTKLVRLEGEVVHAGYYSVGPGETLHDVVERAGGLTPAAYLFGAELTRESTRVAQQQRLDDYVSSLELEVDRASASTAAKALSAQDQAAASSSLGATQLLVSRLRQLRATGRIVLNMQPDAHQVASLPNLPLEDGDRFIVPSAPSSINVVGAVYDQNSFIFNRERRLNGYLHAAGGPNRDADPKHAFIVRADGSVTSRESASTLWGNTFDQARINPGDTIVMPEKVYRGSSIRNVLDYTQLFSQLALGAGALAVITR
jgi:protein involved in polysaccharide export with SLBB domain